MNKTLNTLLCLCLSYASYAQINRVYNPSFEQISQCPSSNWQAYYADGWSGLDTSYFGAGQNCNPYLLNSCSSNFGIPSSYNGLIYQFPHSGGSMMAFQYFAYDSLSNINTRSYLHGKIISLIPNNNYCIKYYIVLNNASRYGSNNQSVYLDDGSVCSADSCLLPRTWVTPQINNQIIIGDTLDWTKLEGVFNASGNEHFINFGNFADHTQTQVMLINASAQAYAADYILDDVSVIDYNLPAFAGTDASIAIGDSVYLGRPNEIGPECRWLKNGLVVDSNLGFWAKPTQPTQYVLQQKICGNVKYDTVFVNISGHDGLNDSRRVGDNFKLLPNPNNGSFIISSTQATYNNVIIYSIDGKEVYNSKLIFTKGNANFDLDLPNGVYHVKLIGSSGIASQKLVISK